MKNRKIGFSTGSIHIGDEPDYSTTGDVVMPIHLSTTFARKEISKPPRGYEYSRTGNPTRTALEKKLAFLEDVRFALTYSSGLAAETSILLALLEKGDHVIAFDDLYGGTIRLFNTIFTNFGKILVILMHVIQKKLNKLFVLKQRLFGWKHLQIHC